MKVDLENRQAHPESDRAAPPANGGTPHVKNIGPHDHSWEFYARGSDGATYEVCQLCGTRRANVPLVSAAHRDWIEGTATWRPTEDQARPQITVTIPSSASVQAPADDDEDGDDAPVERPRRGRPPKKPD